MNKDIQASNVWLYGATVLLVLVAAIFGGYFLLSNYFNRGELGTKSYYATLQGVEFDNRGDKNPNPILKTNVDGTGLNILGVIGRDSSRTRVWVILNQVSPEGLPLVLPQGISIDANCGLIMNTISSQQVAEPVRQYLLRECSRP
jgi:hypothetical protein